MLRGLVVGMLVAVAADPALATEPDSSSAATQRRPRPTATAPT
jgi:hypothetical protein